MTLPENESDLKPGNPAGPSRRPGGDGATLAGARSGPRVRAFTHRALVFLALILPLFTPGRALAAEKLVLEKPPVDVDWESSDYQEIVSKTKASAPKKALRPDRLFATVEFKSKLKNMPKWERVLRLHAGKKNFADAFGPARQREGKAWKELAEKYSGASDLEKAKAVNAFFNQWPYRQDITNYGVEDYWATPDEFIKNSGDCEDYAITKFFALASLGVDPANMRIVALRDSIRNVNHAVMALYTNNSVYILDNLTRMVLTHDNFMSYRPYFSVNGVYKWTHVPPK